jgi:VWFA-related protein
MRRTLPVLAALALTAPIAAQNQTIKVSTASVPVYVTVTDTERRLVPDLTIDDFEILDNGKPQTVNVFENKPVPITTTVMIDTSGSMTGILNFVKDGAEQFLIRLLPDDKAQVGEFSDKIKFHPGTFIDDRHRMINLLKN